MCMGHIEGLGSMLLVALTRLKCPNLIISDTLHAICPNKLSFKPIQILISMSITRSEGCVVDIDL